MASFLPKLSHSEFMKTLMATPPDNLKNAELKDKENLDKADTKRLNDLELQRLRQGNNPDLEVSPDNDDSSKKSDVSITAGPNQKKRLESDVETPKIQTGVFSWIYFGQMLANNTLGFLIDRGKAIKKWLNERTKSPTPPNPGETPPAPTPINEPPADKPNSGAKKEFSDKDKDVKNAQETGVDPDAKHANDTPQFQHNSNLDPSLADKATPTPVTPEPDKKQEQDEKYRAEADKGPRPGAPRP